MGQQSNVLSQENPGQASVDCLHFPGATRNLEVAQPEAPTWNEYYWMPKKGAAGSIVFHQDATSLKIRVPKHRETDGSLR